MSYMSEKAGVLDWVERGCRRLMAAGGGALPGEYTCDRQGTRTTPEQIERIMELARTGAMTARQIGDALTLKPSVVRHVTYYRGITLPDERTMKHKRAA